MAYISKDDDESFEVAALCQDSCDLLRWEISLVGIPNYERLDLANKFAHM